MAYNFDLEKLQAESKERHRNKDREFYISFAPLVVVKEPKPKITFKEKAKNITDKINKDPIVKPVVFINRSVLNIQDLIFYEVPKGKLSKPKRRYEKRREALAEFEKKIKRIKAIAERIQSKI